MSDYCALTDAIEELFVFALFTVEAHKVVVRVALRIDQRDEQVFVPALLAEKFLPSGLKCMTAN